MVTPTLAVWLRGQHVADLVEVRSRQLSLRWTAPALARWPTGSVVLSTRLPVREKSFSVGETRPYVEGLLPEGENRTLVERLFAVPRGDVFRLLRAVGAECAGAVQVLPPGAEPVPVAGHLVPADVPRLVQDLPVRPLGVSTEVRLSLAGLQDKVLLTRGRDGTWFQPRDGAPSTHILKPQPAAYPDLVDAEHFGLDLARAAGCDAARSEVLDVAGRPVLAVERYDRRTSPAGAVERLHQEDFCQATGRLPEQKYQQEGGPGWRDLATVLRAVATRPPRELVNLLRAMVVTVVLGNSDAHARNFSLILEPGDHRLAPLYDLVPVIHLRRALGAPPLTTAMAMSIAGRWELEAITRTDLQAEAGSWPVPRGVADREIDLVLDRVLARCERAGSSLAERVAERAKSLRV